MLLKELHKESKIITKDLLLTPVGLLCYVVDCLNSGLNMDMIYIKINNYNTCKEFMLELNKNPFLVNKISSEFKELKSLKSIFNLC